MRRRIAAALAAVLVLAGCGYRLAGRNQVLPASVKVIGVPPFANKTRTPEIEQRITEAITETFILRGGYRTTPSATGADAVLKGEVIAYDVTPVAVGADGRANRYEVVIAAAVQLDQVPGGEVLFRSSHFVFKRQYDVEGGVVTYFNQEIVAIDLIARDFAQSVVTSILEGF
ncbi:MAG: LPS assembly lipoprotein LptE [Candidatus Polarisedimenticolia bacterium]